MIKDSLNVWYNEKRKTYHIRHNNKHKSFKSYLEAKQEIERLMQTIMFHAVAKEVA